MKYLEKRNKNLIFLFILIILGISLFFFWTRTIQELKIPADGYFNISFNLTNKGIFSLQNPGLDSEATPTMRRAPGYPYFLSGLVTIFKLEGLQKKCLLKEECDRFLKYISFIFSFICILSIVFLFLTCQLLGANYLASVFVSIISMMLVSKEMIVNYNSESLALVLFSISSYFLASFVKTQKKREIFLFSIFLGLLILTRNVFLYFIPFFFIVILIFGYEKKNNIKQKGINLLIFSLMLTFVISPWMLRNNFIFDSFSIAQSGSVKVLSNRYEHNNMSNKEFLGGFLYWAPIPGIKSLIEKKIPREYWNRYVTESEEGFRVVARKNAAKLIQNTNYSEAKIYLLKKILSDPIQNFKVSILMGWRGLKYCFIFFPFFILFFVKNLKNTFYISIFSLTIFNLLFHSLFTHFNVRYGYPMVYGFAVSTALYFSMRMKKCTKF
tara:strand:- start:48 stop:1367 length:1320 start_codon:yes stop_codon:yes gene_type:complete